MKIINNFSKFFHIPNTNLDIFFWDFMWIIVIMKGKCKVFTFLRPFTLIALNKVKSSSCVNFVISMIDKKTANGNDFLQGAGKNDDANCIAVL